jgi:hypothetical protein
MGMQPCTGWLLQLRWHDGHAALYRLAAAADGGCRDCHEHVQQHGNLAREHDYLRVQRVQQVVGPLRRLGVEPRRPPLQHRRRLRQQRGAHLPAQISACWRGCFNPLPGPLQQTWHEQHTLQLLMVSKSESIKGSVLVSISDPSTRNEQRAAIWRDLLPAHLPSRSRVRAPARGRASRRACSRRAAIAVISRLRPSATRRGSGFDIAAAYASCTQRL